MPTATDIEKIAQLQKALDEQNATTQSYLPALEAARTKLNQLEAEYNSITLVPPLRVLNALRKTATENPTDENKLAYQQAVEARQPALQQRQALSAQIEVAKAERIAAYEPYQNSVLAAEKIEEQIAIIDPSQADPEVIKDLNQRGILTNDQSALLEAQREESAAIFPPPAPPPVISDEEADLLEIQREESAALFAPLPPPPPPVISDEEADLLQIQREEGEAIAGGIKNQSAAEDASAGYTNKGLQGEIEQTRTQATAQSQTNYETLNDWRVKLTLADGDYLYNMSNPGILAPLKQTKGVIFPYTPQIQVQYTASYEPNEVVHSNYKIHQYRSSSVDTINITGNFTAQDTDEANYLLAVIHFFRSMTKMFYGQDNNPIAGTPPPLCYLTGLGSYQFNNHPLAITGFTYTLPDNVDYIRATIKDDGTNGSNSFGPGQSNFIYKSLSNAQNVRRDASNLGPGGSNPSPNWSANKTNSTAGGSQGPTYVPTQIQLAISCIPIISRFNISNKFSLEKYARGTLVKGGFW